MAQLDLIVRNMFLSLQLLHPGLTSLKQPWRYHKSHELTHSSDPKEGPLRGNVVKLGEATTRSCAPLAFSRLVHLNLTGQDEPRPKSPSFGFAQPRKSFPVPGCECSMQSHEDGGFFCRRTATRGGCRSSVLLAFCANPSKKDLIDHRQAVC